MLLQEFNSSDKLEIITEGSSNTRMRLRGIVQRADEANENSRIYPKAILERETKKLSSLIKENRLCGELDHPQHDIVKLSNASHKITNLWMEGNEVWGELELLSTPAGKVAQALIRDGVNIGISSRGLGTLREDADNPGVKYVNEDYDMKTYDLVADPSTRGAFPGLSESVETKVKIEKAYRQVLGEKVFLTLLENKLQELLNPMLKRALASKAKVAARGGMRARLGPKFSALRKRKALGKRFDKEAGGMDAMGAAKAEKMNPRPEDDGDEDIRFGKKPEFKDVRMHRRREAIKKVGKILAEEFEPKKTKKMHAKMVKHEKEAEQARGAEGKPMKAYKAEKAASKTLQTRIAALRKRGIVKGKKVSKERMGNPKMGSIAQAKQNYKTSQQEGIKRPYRKFNSMMKKRYKGNSTPEEKDKLDKGINTEISRMDYKVKDSRNRNEKFIKSKDKGCK